MEEKCVTDGESKKFKMIKDCNPASDARWEINFKAEGKEYLLGGRVCEAGWKWREGDAESTGKGL